MALKYLGLRLSLLMFLTILCRGSHFNGGTISCDHVSGTTAKCYWSTGWVLNLNGTPCCKSCSASSVGGLSPCNHSAWTCASGCSVPNVPVTNPAPYTMKGWNTQNNWEQGASDFTYSFSGNGPFTVEYAGCCWRPLYNGIGWSPSWSVRTTFTLGARSDTGRGNSSPRILGLPVYRYQYGCGVKNTYFTMIDNDNDNTKCRWATGSECAGICQIIPHATVTNVPSGCLLALDTSGANTTVGGWYAVALVVEDFPTSPITIGAAAYSTSTPISSVPLQIGELYLCIFCGVFFSSFIYRLLLKRREIQEMR